MILALSVSILKFLIINFISLPSPLSFWEGGRE